jgi:hypothetical protein
VVRVFLRTTGQEAHPERCEDSSHPLRGAGFRLTSSGGTQKRVPRLVSRHRSAVCNRERKSAPGFVVNRVSRQKLARRRISHAAGHPYGDDFPAHRNGFGGRDSEADDGLALASLLNSPSDL